MTDISSLVQAGIDLANDLDRTDPVGAEAVRALTVELETLNAENASLRRRPSP